MTRSHVDHSRNHLPIKHLRQCIEILPAAHRFGAPHANGSIRLLNSSAGHSLWLARGVSDEFAVVVDLPLATPAHQNVFGPSETPVFSVGRRAAGQFLTTRIDRPTIERNH